MSNFDTLAPYVSGQTGTAPMGFSASTEDNLATITTAGYLNDIAELGLVKRNDFLWINYLATDLASAVLALFRVEVAGANTSLVAYPAP